MKKRPITVGSVFRWIAMVICVIVIICSAVYLLRLAWESHQVRQANRSAADQFIREDTSGLSNENVEEEAGAEETASASSFSVDFASLQSASPFAVGWIQVSGIDEINYPVMQYENDDYYLDHSWDGQSSRYGAIFLEANNSSNFSDAYTLIYGHNMKDGSMFGSLKKYADASFYQENGGVITLYLPTETRTYQIFSVRYVAPDDSDTYTLWAQGDDAFGDAVASMKRHSLYDTGVTVTGEDSILTLSTCAGENRLVVHAKLVTSVAVS